MTVRLGRFGQRPDITRGLVDLCRELHRLEPAQRGEALLSLTAETQDAIDALSYEWYLWARPEQLAPAGGWRWWVMSGGRGGGKTRAASEQVIEWADVNPGERICLLGLSAGSVRRIMLLGESGLMRRSPPWFKPRWYKTDKLLVWPNETMAELHSAEEPGTLRGPQYHRSWVTELFHFPIPKGEKEPTAWREGIKLTLRLGEHPQGIIDSSPRTTEFCVGFLLGPKDPKGDRMVTQAQIDAGEWTIAHELTDQDGRTHTYRVVIRRWSSERNAENLSPGVIAEWRHDLRGSRLEEQELDGRILAKVEGALWSLEAIDARRVYAVPRMQRVLVSVDPTRSDSPVDEAGIIVGGLGIDNRVYVWDDASGKMSPTKWAKRAIELRNKWSAEAIVREKNRLPEELLRLFRTLDAHVKVIDVTATTGKRTRAEPVSALYEEGRVSHVRDRRDPHRLSRLEDEMVSWDPRDPKAKSPGRMDALVWLITELCGLSSDSHKPIRML